MHFSSTMREEGLNTAYTYACTHVRAHMHARTHTQNNVSDHKVKINEQNPRHLFLSKIILV